MNWLDKRALIIASSYVRQTENHLIYNIKLGMEYPYALPWHRWKVPTIQRQSFAERIHYMWLCLTRNIAITDKHGNVIWEPHEVRVT